jgi:hypothetical protein
MPSFRFICREDHDDKECPSGPLHDFTDGGWTTSDENGIGCFWCRRCGEVRQLMPATVQAPDLEKIGLDTRS